MIMKKILSSNKSFFIAFCLLCLSSVATAQCSFHNDAFKSGEYLSYNLYYNWKFVWVKAGTASLSTIESRYGGQRAYRSSLITRGSSRADNFFVLRDTLLCYASLDMEPLYYRKGAREGDRYTVDEAFYSYPNGMCKVRQQRLNNDGSLSKEERTSKECLFDMMNIFMRARSFNPTSWKQGNEIRFTIIDGVNTLPGILRYGGKTVVKADNGVKYRCLKLSYIENDNNKRKEIATFYVSDDQNHVPIRIDLHLRFGSAKAFVVGMRGLRNKVESIVR